MYKTISLLLLCALLLAFVPFAPANGLPCYGPAYEGHPELQAECQHNHALDLRTADDAPCKYRWLECMRRHAPTP